MQASVSKTTTALPCRPNVITWSPDVHTWSTKHCTSVAGKIQRGHLALNTQDGEQSPCCMANMSHFTILTGTPFPEIKIQRATMH